MNKYEFAGYRRSSKIQCKHIFPSRRFGEIAIPKNLLIYFRSFPDISISAISNIFHSCMYARALRMCFSKNISSRTHTQTYDVRAHINYDDLDIPTCVGARLCGYVENFKLIYVWNVNFIENLIIPWMKLRSSRASIYVFADSRRKIGRVSRLFFLSSGAIKNVDDSSIGIILNKLRVFLEWCTRPTSGCANCNNARA